jgi:hypothetical protein
MQVFVDGRPYDGRTDDKQRDEMEGVHKGVAEFLNVFSFDFYGQVGILWFRVSSAGSAV